MTDADGRGFRSERIATALQWAVELHARQYRKGTTVPYVAHVIGVASLVLEDGGDEDEFIAALLHDSLEDAGVSPDQIERRFGPRVRRMVESATDTLPDGRRGPETWQARKQLYLDHLKELPEDALRVALADKLHNARAMRRDYRMLRDELWTRFNAGKDDQLWYYRELTRCFGDGTPFARELRAIVEELERS